MFRNPFHNFQFVIISSAGLETPHPLATDLARPAQNSLAVLVAFSDSLVAECFWDLPHPRRHPVALPNAIAAQTRAYR